MVHTSTVGGFSPHHLKKNMQVIELDHETPSNFRVENPKKLKPRPGTWIFSSLGTYPQLDIFKIKKVSLRESFT